MVFALSTCDQNYNFVAPSKNSSAPKLDSVRFELVARMNSMQTLKIFSLFLAFSFPASAQNSRTGTGLNLPWSKEKIASHRPAIVTPPGFSSQDEAGAPPSDATVLFDGTDLSKWKGKGDRDAAWKVEKGYAEVIKGTGSIRTREDFTGDCQWHIEWCTPKEVKGKSQGRGNSGVFIGGYPEVQVLDSFQNDTYPDGQASALYKKSPPLVNASRGPGQWQTYDIICLREKRDENGKVVQPGSITVLHNGIVTQFAFQVGGKSNSGGLSLQDHGNPVRYRNIWVRPLQTPAVPREEIEVK